jgi:hypothetical protein
MPDSVLDLIGDIAQLRRQIEDRLGQLKFQIDAGKLKRVNRFQRILMMRHGNMKLNFMAANLREQASAHRDITEWWLENVERASIENTDPEIKIQMLREIKTACENELTSELPRLEELASGLEALRQGYKEMIGK